MTEHIEILINIKDDNIELNVIEIHVDKKNNLLFSTMICKIYVLNLTDESFSSRNVRFQQTKFFFW